MNYETIITKECFHINNQENSDYYLFNKKGAYWCNSYQQIPLKKDGQIVCDAKLNEYFIYPYYLQKKIL